MIFHVRSLLHSWNKSHFVMVFNPLIDIRFSLLVCYPGLLRLCSLEILVSTFLVMSLAFCQFSSIQLFSHVQLFVTPWTAAHQASPSITDTWSRLKLMSIALVMPSNHIILCHPLFLPPSIFHSIQVFSNELVLCINQSIGVSASASVFPMNSQD